MWITWMRLIPVALIVAGTATAGRLQIGEPTVENGSYTFPILLSDTAEGVAALDFRLRYDPAVFSPVSASSGAAANAANKMVNANVPAPGEYKVVMMGLNQNTVPGGEVAQVVFNRVPGAGGDESPLELTEPTLATWEGNELPAEGSRRDVQLDGAAAQPGQTPAKPGSPAEPAEERPAGDAAAPDPVAGQSGGELPGMTLLAEGAAERRSTSATVRTGLAAAGAALDSARTQTALPASPDGRLDSPDPQEQNRVVDEHAQAETPERAMRPETVAQVAAAGPITRPMTAVDTVESEPGHQRVAASDAQHNTRDAPSARRYWTTASAVAILALLVVLLMARTRIFARH